MTNDCRKILVVDDNFANRLIARTLLVREGYSVTLAESGLEALRLCHLFIFDLILMDIEMPGLDGIETFRRLKAESCPNAHTSVFALTAYTSIKKRSELQAEGLSTVLSKPLNVQTLAKAWHHAGLKLAAAQSSPSKSTPTANKPDTNVPIAVPLINTRTTVPLRESADPQSLIHLINVFWKAMDQNILDMSESLPAFQKGHYEGLPEFRKGAHTIKGATLNIGALRASEISADLQNSPPSDIVNVFKNLLLCLLETKPALKRALLAPISVDYNSPKDTPREGMTPEGVSPEGMARENTVRESVAQRNQARGLS